METGNETLLVRNTAVRFKQALKMMVCFRQFSGIQKKKGLQQFTIFFLLLVVSISKEKNFSHDGFHFALLLAPAATNTNYATELFKKYKIFKSFLVQLPDEISFEDMGHRGAYYVEQNTE